MATIRLRYYSSVITEDEFADISQMISGAGVHFDAYDEDGTIQQSTMDISAAISLITSADATQLLLDDSATFHYETLQQATQMLWDKCLGKTLRFLKQSGSRERPADLDLDFRVSKTRNIKVKMPTSQEAKAGGLSTEKRSHYMTLAFNHLKKYNEAHQNDEPSKKFHEHFMIYDTQAQKIKIFSKFEFMDYLNAEV